MVPRYFFAHSKKPGTKTKVPSEKNLGHENDPLIQKIWSINRLRFE